MAITAATVKSFPRVTTGGVKEKIVDITWDGAYAAGGEALTAATLGFTGVLYAFAVPTSGYLITYDITNALLKAWECNSDAADGPFQDCSGAGPAAVTRMYVVGW